MVRLTSLTVFVCLAAAASAGMFDGVMQTFKGLADNFGGKDNPMMQGIQQMMQMVQSEDFMKQIESKFGEMSKMATEMTGKGAQVMQAAVQKGMEEFEQLKNSGASPEKMQQFLQQMMSAMQQ